MSRLSFHDRMFLQRLMAQQGAIKRIFDGFARESGVLLSKWSDNGGDSVWKGNASIERKIELLLDALHADLTLNMISAASDVWDMGNVKADKLVEAYIRDMAISALLRDKMFERNSSALNTLMKRKDEFGKTISSRVWNIAGGAKDNLEYYLASGLAAGRPATLISQDIRQLLNNPDRRFRRIRDENGDLVPSRPMRDYHPGRGVYRSAYKNALRLAATETNKAYRTADYERWQNMDFITGYEVERSPTNHGPCPICDAKVGKYPKGFKFTGWHPFCICIATPIMMDHEEFAEWLLGDGKPKDSLRVPDDGYQSVPTTSGRIRIHKGHGKGERADNIRVASYFANKYGYEIDLLDNPNGVKSADSYNRTLGYEEEYKVNKRENPTKSSIDNLLRKAKEQADHIVLWVDSNISLGDLRDALSDRVRRSGNIKSVTIVLNNKDCTYTRDLIIKDNFQIKQADLK